MFYKEDWKKRHNLVNFLIFLLFFLSSFIYLYRSFAHNLLPAFLDIYGYQYPVRNIVKAEYLKGILPLWNSYMFSGFPLMASSQHAVFYPLSLIPTLLFPVHVAFKIDILIHYTLAGFFTFLYAQKIGVKNFAALSAGFLFAFMGYFTPYIGHFSVMRSAIWLPLILYFFEDIRKKGDMSSTLFASFAIALQIYAGHFQICFYTYMILIFYTFFSVFSLDTKKKLRFLFLITTAFAVGFIISSPQLYASYELSSLSVRQKLTYVNFSSHSFPLSKVPNLIFPWINGKPEGYIGQIPILLAAVALAIGWKGNFHIRFWICIAFLSLSLALGDVIRPLNQLMYQLPIYNSFRNSLRHIIEFSLSLSLLSAFGISFILNGSKSKKSLIFLAGLMGAVFGISLFALKGSETSMSQELKATLLMFSFLLPLTMLAVFFKSSRYRIFKFMMILVIVFEIVSFNSIKWIKTDRIDNYHSALFSRFGNGNYRVAFFEGDILSTIALLHGVSIVEGFDPLILKEYNSLLQLRGIGIWPEFWPVYVENNMILSLLNTRYIVLPPEREIIESASQYKLILTNSQYLIYENMNVLPRAFSVSTLIGADKFETIKAALFTYQINPVTEAMVSVKDLEEIKTNRFTQGKVSLFDYTHRRVSLKTPFMEKGLVVLSDQY
jgi:hypothetical protein